jgi:hypothetical protein
MLRLSYKAANEFIAGSEATDNSEKNLKKLLAE